MDQSKENRKTSDPSIQPFHITIPQTDLDDLQVRLQQVRWPDELPGVGESYGVSLGYMKDLVSYWQTSYDWRKQEARLNEFPQFTTTIDGAKIHFLHVRSPEPNALPLIINHGWPGSIVEFLDIIGPLTQPRDYGGSPEDAFHLVIPSMPGFGFSAPTTERGWDVQRMGSAYVELMSRLGYDRYGVQGGDFGSAISLHMGHLNPTQICGIHLNYLPTPPSKEQQSDLSIEDQHRISRMKDYLANPAGYRVIQSTRPQTLAYSLTDSPVGQLAWIVEKFQEWTDPTSSIDRDQLLTNVMLYWLTRTAGSSARLYYETKKKKKTCSVPIGVAVFPYDLILPVRGLAESQYDIVHWREFNRGGHFAALEVPDIFTEDVQQYFRRFRSL